jgi:hypothetical protein
MSRYYILSRTLQTDEWWVLAETADHAWATDQAVTWGDSVVLSEEEALLDPDFQEPMKRWRARDDSTLHEDMALGEVQDVIDTEAANTRIRELKAKGLTLDEIASTVAEESVRAHSPAAERARTVEWFDAEQRVTLATHGLFWTLGELAKIDLAVAKSVMRQFARELRKTAASDKFWTLMLEIQNRPQD